MRLRQLAYAVAVARHRSFTRAAEQLFVSQPALSQQVRQLEAALGVQVLDRSGRHVRPTPAGARLLPRMERILAEAEALEREASELAGAACATLSVAAVPAATEACLARVLADFTVHHPQVSLEVHESGSLDVAELVQEGTVDLGIASWSPQATGWYEGLHCDCLALGEMVACVPAASPLAGRGEVAFAELEGQPLILFRQGYLTRELVLAAAPWDVTRSTVFSTDNGTAARQMVAAGIGIAFLSALPGCRPEAHAATRLLAVRDPTVPIGLCALTAPGGYLTRVARTFLRLVAAALADPSSPGEAVASHRF